MLRFSSCDYSDAYVLVKWNIIVNNAAADGAAVNKASKKVIFKVMSMYDLIEYSNNYSKTSGSLWQYCKEIPAAN